MESGLHPRTRERNCCRRICSSARKDNATHFRQVAPGANVTIKIVLWPGARICPFAPLVVKPTPEIVVLKIVKLDHPEFATDTAVLLLFAISTFPKLTAEGSGDSWPGALPTRNAAVLVALPAELLATAANNSPLSNDVVVGVV